MDVSGHDTDFASLWVDDTWAVGSHKTRLALALEGVGDPDLVGLRDSFCDGDDQGHLSLDGLDDGISSKRRWDIDDRGVRLCLLDCIPHASKNGEAQVGLSSLLWAYTTDELCSICKGLFTVERSCTSCETLADDLGVSLDKQVFQCVLVGRAQDRGREGGSERLGSEGCSWSSAQRLAPESSE